MVVNLQSLLNFFMAKNNLNNNDGNMKTVIKANIASLMFDLCFCLKIQRFASKIQN